MADRSGFTLVEMLVAMAVFALAAMALLNLSGENTRSAARVEDRTLGGVVAENVAVESAIAPQLPDGSSDGRVTLAGRDWDRLGLQLKKAYQDAVIRKKKSKR